MTKVNYDYFTGDMKLETPLHDTVQPIEVWIENTKGMKKLLVDFYNHAENGAGESFTMSDEEDFKRHCAISLRQFLESK